MKREDVRKAVIVALAADDTLGELLVLKGGNALGIVHQIGDRASLDVDYSIEGDIDDPEAVRLRVERALNAEFMRRGYHVFDVKLKAKPNLHGRENMRPTWGGWAVEFKLVTHEDWHKYAAKPLKRTHVALELDGDKKAFQIDISKYEYVKEAEVVDFEGYSLRVYSLSMIVFEKLRALCQQLPEYRVVAHPRPRPRDFVDIQAILAHHQAEVLAQSVLLAPVFGAKDVPPAYLRKLLEPAQRDFHAAAWVQVQQQLPNARSFEFYYSVVTEFIEKLEALGVVEPPTR